MSILRSVRTQNPDQESLAERVVVLLGVGLPPVGLLIAIIVLWGHGVGWLDIGLMMGLYFLTLLGITLGYHRLFTHRSFETSAPIKFTLAALGSMAWQGPVIKWVAVHRRHHQKSDRDGDPHSPHLHGGSIWERVKGALHSHMGWLLSDDEPDLARSVSDLLNDPVISLADRLFWLWVALGLAVPALIGGLVSHRWQGAATGLLWGGLVRMCLTHHVTGSINSVCHLWGSQPFKGGDHSRNNALFGVAALGEGWHNNHHAFPTSARHGLRWWQVDVTWLTIRAMEAVGLARNIRLPAEGAVEAKAGQGLMEKGGGNLAA